MAETDVSLCNVALLSVGADEINSFDDNLREAKLCKSIYPIIRETLFQEYPWKFATGLIDLGGPLVAPPLYGYTNAFQIPASVMRIWSLEDNTDDYKIRGKQLHTDKTTARILATFAPVEADFPAYFKEIIIHRLMMRLALSLHEDKDKYTILAQAERIIRATARNLDSQQDTVSTLPDINYTLINIRV